MKSGDLLGEVASLCIKMCNDMAHWEDRCWKAPVGVTAPSIPQILNNISRYIEAPETKFQGGLKN